MFSSLRYLALISLLLVLIGAVALGLYFRKVRADELLHSVQAEHEAIVASYTDTIWQKFFLTPAGQTPPPTETFEPESQRFFRNFPIQKTTIFSPDVTQSYYSSTTAVVTSDGVTRITLFDLEQPLKGRTVSRILKKSYLPISEQPDTAKVLIQTIVPLLSPDIEGKARIDCLIGSVANGCTPIALAELYTDITPRWHAMQTQQLLFSSLIVMAFFLLGSAVLFTTKRAEMIIARQHEVNLELTAAAARAEAQSRDKSQFLASVSHELRTPLNAIIGFSEIVKTEAKEQLQKVYHDYIEDIYASGKHLLSLINDILDYSKAEAGKLQIEWAETDVTKVIRNSLRMVLPRAENAQITLIEEVPSQHLVIISDAKKLKQILLNLLSNAVKFTPAGGEVRCQVWEDVKTNNIMIQVRDTGIGIAPKDISKVMTPFGQVDSALSRKYEGTGLGLPLAKVFLESMGGEFSIASEINVGTTVTLSIPKSPKLVHPQEPLPAEETSRVAPAPDHTAA